MQKSLLALLGMSSGVFAAQNTNCAPEPPATCYPDDCRSCYCLGPADIIANAPARPVTCDGDWVITVAGFYWTPHQDGMEYAIDNHVQVLNATPPPISSFGQTNAVNNLIDANYANPNFKWDFGFKVGVGYNTTCDGWDIGVVWTQYKGHASSHIEAEQDDNHTLIPLWSDFNGGLGGPVVATDIETSWSLDLNLVDIELGREYWVSKMLTLRPFIGLRIASIGQDYVIQNKGGTWSARTVPVQLAFNNEVDLSNDFKGTGLRAGLDSVWHLGCGWGIYGNLAASIVYGRFEVDHDEDNRQASNPHEKTAILETTNSFRASRAMLDLGLGLQWMGMFCECQYAITIALGYEQHIFFHQNQMWRVNKNGRTVITVLPNNNGDNTFYQSRGNLDTQGVTLKVVFDF